MGSQEEKFGLEHALGKTNVSRTINPTIRGSIRRSDPDGGHAEPYFSTLTGKNLTVEVTPVGDQVISFSSDDLADAIAAINAISPANLRAEDDDGYLRLINLNSGNKNKLVIKSGTAVGILGLLVSPEPGSTSYAGEVTTSAPGRSSTSNQSNPQGTALVANNEDLTSEVINRAIFGAVRHIERIVRGLDIEIPIVKKIAVTVSTHVPTGKKVFVIQDGTLRFPIQGFGITANPAPTAGFDKLVSLRSSPNDLDIFDPFNAGGTPRISAVYYNDGTNAGADNTTNFATWGTIDGKSIFASQTKNKQAAVNITAIRGDILVAPTALFVTNVCQPGDTVVIESANNNVPFNHNGEFVIVQVLSETMLVVRAKSAHESTFISTEKPTELNVNLPGGTSYGTVRVIVGATIPMSKLMFEVDSWVPNGSYFARVLCFRRVQDLAANELGETLHPGNAGLGTLVSTLTAAMIAYAGGIAWADGTTNPATTVEAQLDKIISDLAGTGGAIKIGANTGANWADATTNPAATVEARLDKIITDLAGAAGTAKIQGVVNGTDLPVGTLKDQLDNISTNWLKMSRANTIGGAQTFSAAVQINNNLNATGDVVIGNDLQVSGATELTSAVTCLSTLDVDGIATFNDDIKHGDRILSISAVSAAITAGSNWSMDTDSFQPIFMRATGASGGSPIALSVPLNVGDRIKSIDYSAKETTSETLDIMVFKQTMAGVGTNIGQALAVALTGSYATYTLDVTDTTLVSGDHIIILFFASNSGVRIGNVMVTYDRP